VIVFEGQPGVATTARSPTGLLPGTLMFEVEIRNPKFENLNLDTYEFLRND
jgi:hypothetical protein